MANTLKMAEVYTIYALLERGWSRRRIAQVLGIDRETVTRYARLAAAAPGGAPPGAPRGCGPPKPAKAPPGSKPDGRGVYARELGSYEFDDIRRVSESGGPRLQPWGTRIVCRRSFVTPTAKAAGHPSGCSTFDVKLVLYAKRRAFRVLSAPHRRKSEEITLVRGLV